MRSFTAQGFVLSSRNHAEADRLLKLYTLEGGLLQALAKGARKPNSKLAPALELFTEASFSLHKKASGDLHLILQAKVLEGHPGLKKDLASITALQVMADILLQSLPGTEPHPEAYQLVRDCLEALERQPGEGEKLLTAFALRWLGLAGHPFELSECAECGTSLQRQKAFLIPHRGGALCTDCCPGGPSRSAVTPAGLEILKKLRSLPLDKVHILKMKPSLQRGLFLLVMDYLERTLERELKTVEYYLKVTPTA